MANYQSTHTGPEIDSGVNGGLNAVRFDQNQSKSDAQKLQAQKNLGVDTTKGSLAVQLTPDATLSNQGKSADAKATGDALAKRVSVDAAQSFTDAEKLQAQQNLGLDTTDGSLQEQLNNKANIDGLYEDLGSGTAGDLRTSKVATDTNPYNYRRTGNGLPIANREYLDELVGGTINWNQLVQNGNFENANYWSFTHSITGSVANNICTFTATAQNGYLDSTSFPLIAGHKYLMTANIKLTTGTTSVMFRMLRGTSPYDAHNIYTTNTTNKQILGGIFEAGYTYNYAVRVLDQRASDWDAIEVSNVMVIDLTALLGTELADLVYILETNHAGAGVKWVCDLFPKLNGGYYAYHANSLESVCTGSHEIDEFNQWDEEWELGWINANGEKASSSSNIRTKNYIQVIPSSQMYFKAPQYLNVKWYDANKNFISGASGYTLAVPPNAYFCKFFCSSDYGTTYNHDICINFSDPTRNGTYEPYKLHTYAMGGEELRGIIKPKYVNGVWAGADGTLNALETIVYDGDTKVSDGTITRKYGYVDLGTLGYTMSASGLFMTVGLVGLAKAPTANSIVARIVSDTYTAIDYSSISGPQGASPSPNLVMAMNASGNMAFNNTAYTDTATFKTAMSGVYLIYELATSTTEEGTPYTQTQIVAQGGTELFTDAKVANGDRDVAIPVGNTTDYPVSLCKKIEDAPDSPSSDGDYVMHREDGENSYIPLAVAMRPAMDKKADIDGYYEELYAGGLTTKNVSNNKVPYLSRTTGGSADVGARETVKNVIYGTVIHNQLVKNGNFATDAEWYILNGSGTTKTVENNTLTAVWTALYSNNGVTQNGIPLVSGHKYLALATVKNNLEESRTIGIGQPYGAFSYSPISAGETKRFAVILPVSVVSGNGYNFAIYGVGLSNYNITISNVMLIDLTQYFGSAQIPDYLYSLEQNETGSGIAQLHQWGFLRRPYYAYNTGTPKSSNPSYKTNTNRNLWNEKWELGSLDDNGAKSVATNKIRSEELFRVLPNSTYGMSAIPQRICGYDANKNFVGLISVYSYNEYLKKFNTPDNVYYLMFSMASSYGTTYKNDICIYYYWDTDFDDDPYVAHEEWTYPIDDTIVGHGIFKLDANNNLYIDGDTLASDGTNTTRFGIVDMGSEDLTWEYVSGSPSYFKVVITGRASGAFNVISSAYITNATSGAANLADKTLIGQATNVSVFVRDDAYTDATTFKAAVSGKYLIYELATPTTSQKEPFTETQTCDDWGIQYTNDKAFDDGNSDVEVPVGFDSEFPANLVAKLEMSPESPADGNGDYIVRQTDGQNEYVKLVIPNELPTVPTSTNGTYVLTATVTGGVASTPTWVLQA